jgi:hypothetical protein
VFAETAEPFLAAVLLSGIEGGAFGAGVPEEDAREYEESVRKGSVLLTINAADVAQAEQARAIFDRFGGAKVGTYPVGEGQTGVPRGGHTVTSTTVTASKEMRD